MSGPIRISAAEQQRLDECSLEPIRTPGAVQPHGVLIVVDALTWDIVSVSANAHELLGMNATDVLGEHLSVVTGPGPLAHFVEVLDVDGVAANPALVAIDGKPFDVILNRFGATILLDFEPSLMEVEAQATGTIFAAILRLSALTTADELWSEAVRELHSITRFDRVMIYHFHPDGHGEVVAEVAAEGMDPYFGLHYPASDIPLQARELYLLKLSRVIADSSAKPAALISRATSEGAASDGTDLSFAELRSVSPRHLEFMRNMGQASTMSFSLVHDGTLVGMITCAHRTTRRLPYAVRRALEILANQVALQLSSISALENLSKQLELRTIRARIVEGLQDNSDISGELLGGLSTMLDLIPADGATVRLNGIVASVGAAPANAAQATVIEELQGREEGLAFVTDSLTLDHPELADLIPELAGVLMVPIGTGGDYIAWFRKETLHSVSWLGNQSASNRQTPLSPRNSFTSWSRDVTGVSSSWHDFEVEATELGRDLERVLFRQSESQLAQLAQQDPLTGLPNRRRLMDRLEHAFAKYARGEELAVLFVDLDGFKAVNDSLGHDVGDLVLIRAGQQLVAGARAQDTVARIGGDEFVIVCENTTAEQAEVVAQRIVEAVRISVPKVDPDAESFRVTVSVGIATAASAFDAADLLKQADVAMYRAKLGGRDKYSL